MMLEEGVKAAEKIVDVATGERIAQLAEQFGVLTPLVFIFSITLITLIIVLLVGFFISSNKTIKAISDVGKLTGRIEEMTAEMKRNNDIVTRIAIGIETKIDDKPLNLSNTGIVYKWCTNSHRWEKWKIAYPVLLSYLKGEISIEQAKSTLAPSFNTITEKEKFDMDSIPSVLYPLGTNFSNNIDWMDFIRDYFDCWKNHCKDRDIHDVALSILYECDKVMQNHIAKIFSKLTKGA